MWYHDDLPQQNYSIAQTERKVVLRAWQQLVSQARLELRLGELSVVLLLPLAFSEELGNA
jgi:hypothetical protein